MTVASDIRIAGPYTSGTILPFAFKVFDASDIVVVKADTDGVESILTEGPDYTVTLSPDQNGTPGGSVALAAAILAGDKVVVAGALEVLQGTSIPNNSGFFAAVIEDALDRATIQIQELRESASRSVKVPVTSTQTPEELLEDLFEVEQNASGSAAAAAASAAEAEASAARVDLGALDEAVEDAEAARDVSQAQAGVATTQAGISTTQAGVATTQAGVSTTQAGLSTAARLGAEAARDAALLSRGLWQTTAQGIGQGVAGTDLLVAGIGGTNGTFDLAFSGGTQVIAPKGYFVVAGGAVTQVVITYAGHYSAGTPTLSFAASPGLTGAIATAVMGANTQVGAYFSVPQSGSDDMLILYRVDTGPVATEVARYPSSSKVDAIEQSLLYPFQSIGITGDLPSGSNASLGTYTFAEPIEKTGKGVRYHYRSLGAGTIYVQVADRVGDDITIIDERLITVSGAGVGVAEFYDLEYTAGQYMGVRISPTGALAAFGQANSGWWYTNAAISAGNTFTDATLTTNVGVIHRFELLEQNVTGDRFAVVEDAMKGIVSDGDAATFHVHFVLGESHAAGVPAALSPVVVPVGRGYCYRRATTSLGHLQDPTGNSSTAIAGAGRGSMFVAFGSQMLRQSDNTNGAIIVNSGQGGTTAVGQWSSGGLAWTQAVTDWGNAITAIQAEELIVSGCSISIILGSNDAAAGTTKVNFKAAILDLISRARTLVGAGSAVPVILMQTGSFLDGSFATEVAYIQEAQAEIVAEEDNVFMGYSARYNVSRGQMIDNVHMSQEFNDLCGASLAVPATQGAGLRPVDLA